MDKSDTFVDIMNNDELVARREELMDFFTPNGNKWNELMELLEIERELTKREE